MQHRIISMQDFPPSKPTKEKITKMLKGLASYLFGGEKPDDKREEDNFEYDTHEEEDEWLLVDIAKSMSTDRKDKDYPLTDFAIIPSPSILVPSLSVLTVHLPEHRGFSSPPRSPTQMEGSWYVTPPSCFTAGGSIQVQMSPLENLLIEHPSMSVYTATPSSSLNTIALGKELECELECEPLQTEIITHVVSQSISVQFVTEKKKRNQLNQTTTNRRLHHQSSLPILNTDLYEQIANIKRGQKAKHYFEQKALQRSKLDRQNITNHYHHSAKNLRRKDHWRHHSGANNNRKC